MKLAFEEEIASILNGSDRDPFPCAVLHGLHVFH